MERQKLFGLPRAAFPTRVLREYIDARQGAHSFFIVIPNQSPQDLLRYIPDELLGVQSAYL